jgi:Uma2 family endonuclease
MLQGQPARTQMTIEQFDEWVALPQNADKFFEYIAGEPVEVPSNLLSSHIAALIMVALGIYLRGNNIGRLTGEAGLYTVGDDRYAPDVAFVSYERLPQLSYEGYGTLAPDLAVEVISPTDNPHHVSRKIINYVQAGTVVWVVYPDAQEVHVHTPNTDAYILSVGDTLHGGNVLPGFSMPIAEIFAELNKND